jgi:hypothetical protein
MVSGTGIQFGDAGPLPNEADDGAAFSGALVTEAAGNGLPTGNADRTFETWLKTSNTERQAIAWWGTQDTQDAFEVGTDSYGYQVYLSGQDDDAYIDLPYSIADGNWHHLAISYGSNAAVSRRICPILQ